MAEISKKELEAVLEKVLNAKRTVDNETHGDHHEFLKMYIQRFESRQKMWQKFKMSAIGTLGAAIIGGLGWLGTLIIEYWPRGHH